MIEVNEKPHVYIKDEPDLNCEGLTKLIHQEHLRQLQKWGIQSHTLPEWAMITTEEFGEFIKECNEVNWRKGDNLEKLKKEAVQTITLIWKMIQLMESGQKRL